MVNVDKEITITIPIERAAHALTSFLTEIQEYEVIFEKWLALSIIVEDINVRGVDATVLKEVVTEEQINQYNTAYQENLEWIKNSLSE